MPDSLSSGLRLRSCVAAIWDVGAWPFLVGSGVGKNQKHGAEAGGLVRVGSLMRFDQGWVLRVGEGW
jgi:hypothetical protein